MKEQTIQEGLGLDKEFSKIAEKIISSHWSNTKTVSDTMEKSAFEIRETELGEVNQPLSNYEKKLLFIGMIIGAKKAEEAIPSILAASIIRELRGGLDPDEG